MTVRTYNPWGGQWHGVDDIVDPPPPPDPDPRPGSFRPASTIYGTSVGVPGAANTPTELDPYRGKTKLALLDQWQNEFAAAAGLTHSNANPLMKAFHNYNDGVPSSLASSQVNGILERNLHGVLNCKTTKGQVAAGTFNSTLQALCNSYTGTKTLYLNNNHEPGNDPGWDATQAQLWRNDQAHWAQKIIQFRGSKPIVPVVCVINWDISPKNHANGNGPPDWQNPAAEMLAAGVDLNEVVYTTDGYDTSPTTLGGAANLYDGTCDRVRDWGFSRFGVSEGACKSYLTSNPNDRGNTPGWIRELKDLAIEKDFEYFLWFASGVGNRAGPEGWWLYGNAPKATWAELCAGVLV